MYRPVKVTEQVQQEAQELLGLEKQELINHWLTHVAVNLDYGHYLKNSTLLSRKQRFARWHKTLTEIASVQIGTEVY